MITKENFDPRKVVRYIWKDMSLCAASSAVALGAYHQLGLSQVALPFAPVSVLGTALAIFLAFRNNTSYVRWTEASQYWQNITTQSRIFCRLVLTFVDSHRHLQHYMPERAATFKQQMTYRQIAWVNTLRLQLRGQNTWSLLRPLLPDDEYQALLTKQNKPAYLMQQHGKHIYDAMADGTLQGFDSFQLEGALAQLAAQQSACERLKTTPVPRQYDYFTRVFVHLFVTLLPFCLLGLFTPANSTWLVVPLALIVAFLFVTIERVGAINESPFENRITDVPLTAICNGIERDLREMLAETALPAKLESIDGYLF